MSYSFSKRSFAQIVLLLPIIVLCFISCAYAEIYKWTDAQGKVHYSDKKIADNAQAQNIDLGTMPAAKLVTALTATRYQHTRPTLYLLRNETSLYQLTSLRSATKFAYLYFGGDCISPTAISYDDYIRRYKNSLPQPNDIFRDEEHLFNKYNIRTQSAQYAFEHPERALDEEGNLPLKIQVEVLDMRINACIQRLDKRTASGNLDKISIHSADKANVWLQLRITISTLKDAVVLLNTITEGSVDEVNDRTNNISILTTAAYKQAITNLIATPQFIEIVTPKSKLQIIKIPSTETPPPTEESGLLTRLADKLQFNYVKKAKLAEAISLVGPLRHNIIQYYTETGKWPVSFSDIDLNAAELQQQGIIDSTELRLGGVLHIRLAKSVFGENEILQLIPKPIMGGQHISWECRTSLDKSLWVGECKEQ